VIAFVEYLEELQPLIASVAGTYFGVQRTVQTLYRRAIGIGVAIMIIGAMLYFTLADPSDARPFTPSFMLFEKRPPDSGGRSHLADALVHPQCPWPRQSLTLA
jgi:hypothetical protein